LSWGVPVPRDGWDDRRIYIWAENVLGYLSASEPEFILPSKGTENLHYYVHGKDNIPFHSVILPGLLMAHGNGTAKYHLPDIIVSSEYITVGGDKLSKSKGNQIFAYTLYENFDVDMVRYFFLRTLSDKRDSNFTVEEFVNMINGELVNNFGNKHFAEGKPWVNNDDKCVGEVVCIIKAAAEMLEPFIPNACAKIKKWLGSEKLTEIEVLWTRLETPKVKEIFERK
jgi:methionyl-tRNA synthetase